MNTTGQWVNRVVDWTVGDTAYISVVFTWHLQDAYQRAVWYRAQGYRVIAGGPGVFTQRDFLKDVAEVPIKQILFKGKLRDTIGDIYDRDAVVRHNEMATVASRGCPVGCSFCIVPRMEGLEFTEIDGFPVRPVLCDNNLSALSPAYQDHIVARYKKTGVPLLDANSGFEPRTFDDEVYARWRGVLRGPWRFAFDDQGDRQHVERVFRMLKDVSPRKKQVYVLIGKEPKAECLERIQQVIAWGGEPYVQCYMKLNALAKQPDVRFDWTERELRRVQRWANGRFWKYVPFADYDASAKSSRDIIESPPQQLELQQ